MSEKVNYTPEMVERMKSAYDPEAPEAVRAETVKTLASEFGKSTKSVIAKLVLLDLYRKAERKTKDGKPVVKKDALADKIGEALGMTEADVTSLTKANKTALEAILNFIEN